jgi:hypothetical protein
MMYLKERLLSLFLILLCRRVQANVGFYLGRDKIAKGDHFWIFGGRIAWYKGKPLIGDQVGRIHSAIMAGLLSVRPKPWKPPHTSYTDPKSDSYYPLKVVNEYVPGSALDSVKPRSNTLTFERDGSITGGNPRTQISLDAQPGFEMDEEIQAYIRHTQE